MLQFTYPGVYTQELPSGVKTISGAPTSVALFLGPTAAGIDGRQTLILNFGDFERSFGGLSQKSSLSYAVQHFFANGGGQAYVVRVPVDGAKAATLSLKPDGGTATTSMTLTALSSGSAGNQIYFEIDPFEIGAKPYETTGADRSIYNLSVLDGLSGRSERFGKLQMAGGVRNGSLVVNDPATGSQLVKLDVPAGPPNRPQPTGSIYALGPIPTGTFVNDVGLRIGVDVLDDTGVSTSAFTPLAVTVFHQASPIPQTALEIVARMAAEINAAILANTTAKAAMEGVTIEAAPFENGRLFRLKTSAPGAQPLTKRLGEAIVTIAGFTSAAGVSPPSPAVVSFLTLFTVTQKVANPSRYRLGSTYPSGQVFGVTSPPSPLAPVVGTDGNVIGQPRTDDFKNAVLALETPDPFFNILCLPDLVRPAATDPNALQHGSAMAIYGEAARICREKFAFLLIDPFPNVTDVAAAQAWKSLSFSFQSSHAAAYFPDIMADDPVVPGSIRRFSPSGAIAGLYARTDADVGVWQAPAGTNAALSGVYGPSVSLSDDQHGILNPLGLNVIRKFPIFGTVAFGARTVDGSNALASEWAYIPVRRTALYLLRSLSEGTRWAVFKPNGEQLWADIRMSVKSFMQGLFGLGAFKGSSPRDAYFVLCDASTTPQSDIDQGIVNIVVGFAPLKPAEFVVISLKQKTAAAA